MSTEALTADPAAATASPDLDRARLEGFVSRLTNPLLIRFFLLRKLPLGFIAGLRVKSADERCCEVTVPYGWRTQNPFRSTYFAAQSMAAEMSTGVLAMLACELAPASVAMLIVNMDATFGKKATDISTFTCEHGDAIFAAVARAVETGEPQTVTAETVGRMPNGVEVSRFTFTWSFKKRAAR